MQLAESGLTNPVRGNFRLTWNFGQKKEHVCAHAFIKDHTGHLRTEKTLGKLETLYIGSAEQRY